jgi:hypothetical protein
MNHLNPHNFYFDLPIYTVIQVDGSNENDLMALMTFAGKIDAYNPNLKENTTFKVKPLAGVFGPTIPKDGGVNFSELTCVRTGDVYLFYYHYNNNNKRFQKIGQYPSIADFHISQIKKYDKVLSKERLKEFTRAIGLAANGVGIGSFVYLRRIFEDLIIDAHNSAKQTDGWNDEDFHMFRMSEKIEVLKDFLPPFLIENKNLYGILSVGVHSLNEAECLAHFETVKLGIELILDEKVEQFNKQKKIEDAKAKIAGLNRKLK